MAKLVPDPRTSIPAAEAAPTDTTARPLEKAADLADRHGQVTRRAVLLQYDADTADPTADDYDDRTITAARAALAAGRFEAARRLAGRVLARAGEGSGALAPALRGKVDDGVAAAARSIEAEARDGLRTTNYARERTARLFANEWAVKLRAVIEAGGAEALELFLKGVPDKAKIAEQARMPVRREGELCALDLVNFVLMHLGGGVGVTLIAGDKGVVQTAFTPHAPGPAVGHDLETLAARLEEAGGAAPCPMCGAPRWTFVADDEQGEACSVCSWPHAPGKAPVVRRQLAAEEARAALREREAQVATLEKQVATLEGAKASLEGRLAKYDTEIRRMRAAPKPPAEEAAEIVAKGRALIADLEAMIVAKKQDDAAGEEVG